MIDILDDTERLLAYVPPASPPEASIMECATLLPERIQKMREHLDSHTALNGTDEILTAATLYVNEYMGIGPSLAYLIWQEVGLARQRHETAQKEGS